MDTEKHAIVPARTYATVWITLLILTGLTITVARMGLGRWSIAGALLIATSKASLVLYFFMHLKYEKPLFQAMFYVTAVILSVFIGFTFFDIAFR
jgi:cytochrome c oxidase subunit 4